MKEGLRGFAKSGREEAATTRMLASKKCLVGKERGRKEGGDEQLFVSEEGKRW